MYDEVVRQATVSSASRVQFTIERVYKRSRKTKLGDFSEIIHQKLPLFDKIPLLKLRKTRLSLKFLEQKEFVLKQNSVIRVQVLLAESI